MTTEPVSSFASVWDALEETPDAASNMRLRSELAIAIRSVVEGWRSTQAEAARRLGVTQPRLNDLLRGRLDRFSIESLVALAEGAELSVQLQIRRVGGALAKPTNSPHH